MIEKIKEKLSSIWGWLATIVGLVIYVLFSAYRTKQLKETLAVEKAKEQLGKVLSEKEEAKKQADSADADYQSIRDEYLRESAGKGDVSGSDKGSGPSFKEEG